MKTQIDSKELLSLAKDLLSQHQGVSEHTMTLLYKWLITAGIYRRLPRIKLSGNRYVFKDPVRNKTRD